MLTYSARNFHLAYQIAYFDGHETINEIIKGMQFKCLLEINTIWHNDTNSSYKWIVKKIIF